MPLLEEPAADGKAAAGGPSAAEQMKALLDSSTPGTKAKMLKQLVSSARAGLRFAMQYTSTWAGFE
jgi:hypothetical protein